MISTHDRNCDLLNFCEPINRIYCGSRPATLWKEKHLSVTVIQLHHARWYMPLFNLNPYVDYFTWPVKNKQNKTKPGWLGDVYTWSIFYIDLVSWWSIYFRQISKRSTSEINCLRSEWNSLSIPQNLPSKLVPLKVTAWFLLVCWLERIGTIYFFLCFMYEHPAGTPKNSVKKEGMKRFCMEFTIVIHENIVEWRYKIKAICLKKEYCCKIYFTKASCWKICKN